MSARAAWRLEELGFAKVYRYEAGKRDWLGNGLPIEGRAASVERVADLVRRDVPTCAPGSRVAEARDRATAAGWNDCVVVNGAGVVLGIVRKKALDGDPNARVDDVMDPGPSTYRLDDPAHETAHFLEQRGITHVLVTTSDGELVGMFFVADVVGERARPRAEGEPARRDAKGTCGRRSGM